MEVTWRRKSLGLRRNQEFPFGPVKFKLSVRCQDGDLGTIKIDIGCFSSEFNREIKLKQLICKSLVIYGMRVPLWPETKKVVTFDFGEKRQSEEDLLRGDMLPCMMEAGKVLKTACQVGPPREGIHWSSPGTCDSQYYFITHVTVS